MSDNEFRQKAQQAAGKAAAYGEDIDLQEYEGEAEKHDYQPDLTSLPDDIKQQMRGTGVLVNDESQRAGTFLQMDNTPVHRSVIQEGIEIMSTREALEKYDWAADYWWKAVEVDKDKYTAHVGLNEGDGYFIRALPGKTSYFPVQACMFMHQQKLAQDVHNIVIAEEGSDLHIINGCTTSAFGSPGLHMGISEFYIKPGARINFTMVHNWTPGTIVRPRTGVIVEENGVFLNNYVIMHPVKSLQTCPSVRCTGDNARVRFNSILVATAGTTMDTGSDVYLEGTGSRAEVISRAITTGGNIIARGFIQGSAPDVKGHLECRGLILPGGGIIHAIPELKGTLAGIDLSHEAAVGKIAEEEVEYLMARGLNRTEATATIVRGFLRVDIDGLPPELNDELQRVVELAEKEAM